MNVPSKVSPLGIIAASITLIETSLSYTITKVTGNAQIILIVFVMGFALLFFFAFFRILWCKPEVFYSPWEWGTMDPKYFVAALTLRNLPKTVADQAELIASVGRNPSDERPQFALINGLLDEVHRQFLILMHVVPCDLLHPEVDNGIEKYEIRYGSEDAENVITGEFDGWMLYSRVKDMGLIEVFAKDKKVSLTKSGHDFAQWLVDSGRKARFMKTGYGGWGELIRKPSEEATDAHGSHSTSVRSTH